MSRAWGEEDTIQVHILEWLRVAVPEAIVYHVPNGGLRTPNTARKLKRLGVMPGVPDLVVMLPAGRTVYIEVKAPKGRLSPEQIDFTSRSAVLGHKVLWARSVDSVRAGFRSLGIATREVAEAAE